MFLKNHAFTPIFEIIGVKSIVFVIKNYNWAPQNLRSSVAP